MYSVVNLGPETEGPITEDWEGAQSGKYEADIYDAKCYMGNIEDCFK